MKSPSTIRRNLKLLRTLIETSDDPVVTRIAYEMEFAVRWATLETVGWGTLDKHVISAAQMLRKELDRSADGGKG